jgi:hypothetical protein
MGIHVKTTIFYSTNEKNTMNTTSVVYWYMFTADSDFIPCLKKSVKKTISESHDSPKTLNQKLG